MSESNSDLAVVVDVADDGLSYMRERLALGRGMAEALLRSWKSGRGKVRAVLPLGVPQAHARRFSWATSPDLPAFRPIAVTDTAGVRRVVVPKPDVDLWLAHTIARHLEEVRSAVCVFEDALSVASDPETAWMKGTTRVFSGDTVLLWLDSQRRDRSAIDATIDRAVSWLTIGVLSSEAGVATASGSEIAPSGLETLCDRADQVIVGAFDGEGLLVWSQEPATSRSPDNHSP